MHFLQPLQIKSVVAKEGLKGYIYIEAYKQTHVKQAIEGIGNLRIGYYQQQVLNIASLKPLAGSAYFFAMFSPFLWNLLSIDYRL